MGRTRGAAPFSLKRQRSVISCITSKTTEEQSVGVNDTKIFSSHQSLRGGCRTGGKRKHGGGTSHHSSATAAEAELLGEEEEEEETISPSILKELAGVLDGTINSNPEEKQGEEPGVYWEPETSQFWTETAAVAEQKKKRKKLFFFLQPDFFDLSFTPDLDLDPGAVDCWAAATACYCPWCMCGH